MRHTIGPLAIFLVGLLTASLAVPCTRVLWSAGDGLVFVGRTQDWTEKANSAFRVYPRGIERTGAVTENPHHWISKYGSLVITGYDLVSIHGLLSCRAIAWQLA